MANGYAINGDCLDILPKLRAEGLTFHAAITDPPYGINIAKWDRPDNIAFQPDVWKMCWDVILPGGFVFAFGSPRTYDRLGRAIRSAGFEIHDMAFWLYGNGFPRRGNLKSACDPILIGRKPFKGSLADNMRRYGTGKLNIEDCRIPCTDKTPFPEGITSPRGQRWKGLSVKPRPRDKRPDSRHPANVVIDDSDAVLGELGPRANFFYSARASAAERNGSKHPTIKPLALTRWLITLASYPGQRVFDPFAGTGTTGEAAYLEGRKCVLIEKDPVSFVDLKNRFISRIKLSEAAD